MDETPEIPLGTDKNISQYDYSSSGSNVYLMHLKQPIDLSYPDMSRSSLPQPEWILASTTKEIAKIRENNIRELSWRRLHLGKAKLKASSRTSALLSGFAMVAMVEISFTDNLPEGILIAFSVCTTLLVAVHLLALMISTCILPNVEAVAACEGPVSESPHERMHYYIELSWAFSTVFGILLFLAEIGILCWVKFIEYSIKAALAGTMLVVPVVVIFVAFAAHFYRKMVTHKYECSAHGLAELENMATQLQNSSNGTNGIYVLNV